MLLLGVALWIACSGDRYYSYDYKKCVTSEQCKELQLFAYRKIMLCFAVFRPADDGKFEPSTKGVYACKAGWYTVFNRTTARCVESAEECVGLYVAESVKACVSNPTHCSAYLGPISYTGEGRLECISRASCYSKGNFVYIDQCVTTTQCAQKKCHTYVYGSMRACRSEVPADDGDFDPDSTEAGVYQCKDKLMDFTTNISRCITEDECKQFVYEEVPLCVTKEYCARSGYLYYGASR